MPALVEIGDKKNFWNLRGSFKPVFFLEFGTQMSIAKLSTGKFVIFSTVGISPAAKTEIDALTNNGENIEAVIATHPFHTMYFEPFHKLYPNAKYYGTPRHLRRFPSIPWAGDVSNESVLRMYESEGIYLRIPAGAEFKNPSEDNHFSSLFVFHKHSKTIHVDDTLMCYEHPGCLLSCFCIRAGQVGFHPVSWQANLLETREAPTQFIEFVRGILNDWDFDNLVAAHTGNKIGGAKAAVQATFDKELPALQKLAQSRQ